MKVTDEMVEAALAAQDKSHRAYAEMIMACPDNEVGDLMKRRAPGLQRNVMIAALEAALAVAPDPAPDDAFAGAVSRFGVLAEDVGTVRTSIWSRLPESEKGREAPPELVAAIEEREAARQRILALHRQATHAGYVAALTEAKQRIEAERVDTKESLNRGIGWQAGNRNAIAQIDALLKEATDDR